MSHKTEFVLLFNPDIEENLLPDWLEAHEGRIDMLDALRGGSRNVQGLIRPTKLNGAPLVFSGMDNGVEQEDDPEVRSVPLFKHRNFEAPNTLTKRPFDAPIAVAEQSSAGVRLRVSDCTVDSLAYRFAKFNLFVPSLLRHIEAYTVAHQLQETILWNVPFCSRTHIVTAISTPSAGRATNCNHVTDVTCSTKSLEEPGAETLIGYRFRDGSLLLEALTHPSNGIDAKTESYQRLEFLGDAVLDVLVSTLLSRCLPELSQGQLTRIKAALVNNNLLGYLCHHFSMDRNLVRIETELTHGLREVRYCEKVPLWQFMRHHSLDLVQAHKNVGHTFEQYGTDIRKNLSEGTPYPWKLLARLDPDKFYSDLVESIFSAIFTDSRGDLSECERFFERIGLTYYATRMAEGTLHVVHPRDELQGLVGSSKLDINV
ncbi:hypothetical protein PMIN05_012114 [Paraphaeosphaeria minitans]